MSNGRESCVICGRDALCIFVTVDKYDYRCDNCGKYIFLNGLHKVDYEDLDKDKKEKISKYIKEYNETTGEWAELGYIEELWKKIEDFNRSRQQEK